MQQVIFIACSTTFGQYYAHNQELESIIQMVLPVVFGALIFRLSAWCGAEGCVSGLRPAALKQQPANRTHNLQLHTIPTT